MEGPLVQCGRLSPSMSRSLPQRQATAVLPEHGNSATPNEHRDPILPSIEDPIHPNEVLFNAVNSQQTISHNIATVSWRANNNIQPTPGQREATSPFDRLKQGIHLLKR